MVLTLLWFFISSSQASVIQILHTNDLHASLRTAGAPAKGEKERGGWAQLKTRMDQLSREAHEKGIETIRLDAGDFIEGTLDYFPDHGRSVLQAFQAIGYDAATLGNHEWLMGARGLNTSLEKAPFPFPILSANARINPALHGLKRTITPHLD